VLTALQRFVDAAPDVEVLDVETAELVEDHLPFLSTSRANWGVTMAARPPRKFPRMLRVNELVRQTLADEMEHLSDPRLELVTITGWT